MKSIRKLTRIAIFALAMGAPMLAQAPSIDFDHSADFRHYKSYRWEKLHATNPAVEQRITIAVDRTLQGMAFHQADKNVDFVVTAVDDTANAGEYVKFYNNIGSFVSNRGWATGGGFTDSIANVRAIPAGTLVIDIYDGKTEKLVWRGTMAQPTAGSDKKEEDSVDKAVTSLLGKFPPKMGKGMPPNQISAPDSPSSKPVTGPS